MSRWINIDDICIPSDENDWDELVAFADAVAEQEPIDLVRCAECRHLEVLNERQLYAVCQKHKVAFGSFEEDTRTHGCSWGERKESE